MELKLGGKVNGKYFLHNYLQLIRGRQVTGRFLIFFTPYRGKKGVGEKEKEDVGFFSITLSSSLAKGACTIWNSFLLQKKV